MKYAHSLQEEPKPADTLIVFIGEHRFRLTETEDGKLKAVKFSDAADDKYPLVVCPSTSNTIIIS